MFCFVFQYIVDWEVDFIIYYDSPSVELSQSNDLGHEFYRLIRVGLCWTNMSSSPCFFKKDVQYVIISIFIKDVDQYAPYFSARKHVWDTLTFCLHLKKKIDLNHDVVWVRDLVNRLKKKRWIHFSPPHKSIVYSNNALFFFFFFFNFILWYLVCLGLSFIIYFISLMDLSLSYDLSHKFSGLTYVDWVFLLFFIDFFYFILQLVEWDLNIIIYFDFFFMGLSQSYNLSHGCDGFTRVIFCFILFFSNFIL